MNGDILFFFEEHIEALPLYETLEKRIVDEIGDVMIKVQKSQISFYNRHLFTCVSFARLRKKKELPPSYIVVTLGLNYKLESPRVTVATEPYPNRWTHHFLVSNINEIDDELINWVKEAAVFSETK